MGWGNDVKTETFTAPFRNGSVDWVWGVGFEGRSARPFGRAAPSSSSSSSSSSGSGSGSGVTDALLTEGNDFIITENDYNLQFEG